MDTGVFEMPPRGPLKRSPGHTFPPTPLPLSVKWAAGWLVSPRPSNELAYIKSRLIQQTKVGPSIRSLQSQLLASDGRQSRSRHPIFLDPFSLNGPFRLRRLIRSKPHIQEHALVLARTLVVTTSLFLLQNSPSDDLHAEESAERLSMGSFTRVWHRSNKLSM